MKQTIIILGIMLAWFHLYSDQKLKADVHLKITDDLPKFGNKFSGVFSVTNTGEIAFNVVTGDWSSETTRFYLEGNEEQQRNLESVHGWAKQWRQQQREQVANDYLLGIVKYPETIKTLLPGESVTFECKSFYFGYMPSSPISLYKAEMYLGEDTWIPVHITPTLGILYAVEVNKGKPTGDFYYSQEGTNQWLYVKTDDGKFKRVSEMKLGTKPQKEKEENAVTFEALDGTKKKLTREQARQIINEVGN